MNSELREALESVIRLLEPIPHSASVEQAGMQAEVAIETARAALDATPAPDTLRRIVWRTASMGSCSQTHHEHLAGEARAALALTATNEPESATLAAAPAPETLEVERLAGAMHDDYEGDGAACGLWPHCPAADDWREKAARLVARLIAAAPAPEPLDCDNCFGSGLVVGIAADPLPSGEPGEPYQVQRACPECGGNGVAALAAPEPLDMWALAWHRAFHDGGAEPCTNDREFAERLVREHEYLATAPAPETLDVERLRSLVVIAPPALPDWQTDADADFISRAALLAALTPTTPEKPR